MEHKIKGTEAEQAIAREITKPWYKKIEIWISVLNIIVLIANIFLTLYPKAQPNCLLGTDAYDQEQRCFAGSVYSPEHKSWRWRAESFNDYFSSKEDAVANCITTLIKL